MSVSEDDILYNLHYAGALTCVVLDDVVMLTLQVGHLIANCKTLKVNVGWNISLAKVVFVLLYLSGSGAVFDAAVGIYCVSTLCADTGCTATSACTPPKKWLLFKLLLIQTTAYPQARVHPSSTATCWATSSLQWLDLPTACTYSYTRAEHIYCLN